MDKTYWGLTHPYPLAPSDDDVIEYKSHLNEGTTLLLGCTKKLISLSDRQLDIEPWYDGETVIVGDWLENKNFYTNMLIDGGLCFTKELCDGIIKMASKNCNVLIARVFNHKTDMMKVADYFPKYDDFEIKPTESILVSDYGYTFFVWKF